MTLWPLLSCSFATILVSQKFIIIRLFNFFLSTILHSTRTVCNAQLFVRLIKPHTQLITENSFTKTAKLRKIITKRGTLEILIPLCCSTTSVRYLKFRKTMKGFSSKTLAKRLKELDESGILERQAYNEIPPRVEYRLTDKG